MASKQPKRPRPTAPRAAPSFVSFVTETLGLPLSPSQRALAAVSFDGAPVPAEFADLFGGFQGPTPEGARRCIAWLCGRASGKTRLAALYILYRCLYADLSRVAKGEIGFGVVFSPTRELSEQTLRFARGALQGTRYERAITNEGRDSFTIKRPDGATVRFAVLAASAKGTTGRGRTLIAAALDEGCFFRAETHGAVNDSDIYRALPPRLIAGGAIVIASTPWTQEGLLYDLWKDEFGAPKTAIVAVAKTERMRDDDPQVLADCARERERDPDNASRELDCEWLPQGAGNAFDTTALARSIVDAVPDAEPYENVSIGGDLGFVQDPSAFVAVRVDHDGVINVVDMLELRPRKGSPLSQTQVLCEAADFAERNGNVPIRVDGHGFAQANDCIEQNRISLAIERCSESAEDREHRYLALIEAFKAGKVKIPRRFAALTDQLARIIATPKSGGDWRFEVARRDGNHADAAMALLLACESLFTVRAYWAGVAQLKDNPDFLMPGAETYEVDREQAEETRRTLSQYAAKRAAALAAGEIT